EIPGPDLARYEALPLEKAAHWGHSLYDKSIAPGQAEIRNKHETKKFENSKQEKNLSTVLVI
ncbi:MAG: hypothetical protein JW821_19495, partial [Deltaproteobacteria bacterium]|nr:hypothetical protein [Deltaproteobacteria bacterium]